MFVSMANQTNPLEAKRCEFASQDAPITPKFDHYYNPTKQNDRHAVYFWQLKEL